MLHYFTDSVLRAPTLGTVFIGIMAALIGVTVVLRRESLVGETLSHAAYPGVMAGVILWGLFGFSNEGIVQGVILGGALISSLLAYGAILFLQNRLKIRADSSLCLILAAFIGLGVFLASIIQFSFTSFYKQAQIYLYGQSATLNDFQAFLFFILMMGTISLLILFHKEIKIYLFDPKLSKMLGLKPEFIKKLLLVLTAVALVAGIRAVGVILMSALMIAPAVSARELTHNLKRLYLIAALLGGISAFFGIVISNELSIAYSTEERFSMPTGPVIVLTAGFITLLILFFNPSKGLAFRSFKRWKFKFTTLQENILKSCYKLKSATQSDLLESLYTNSLLLRWALFKLVQKKWMVKEAGTYHLTEQGEKQALKIIRLHRLWEVYLVNYVGISKERVHKSAEEMEHLIGPELEKELVILLKDPKVDPHLKPIPKGDL